MDSLKNGDEGRSAGEMIGICLNEACNKKARLLFQRVVMKESQTLFIGRNRMGEFEAAIEMVGARTA